MIAQFAICKLAICQAFDPPNSTSASRESKFDARLPDSEVQTLLTAALI